MSTTTATMSNTAMPPPPSPSKQDRFIKPNPHPYAIKTTSTGVLTRSNSTTHSHASRHYYVPPSPTQSNPPDRRTRTHRLSKSLTNEVVPRPLPTPPDHISASQSAPLNVTPKGKQRSGTMPSSEAALYKLEDLPSNPKVWTPSQLSSYLMTALRVRTGETLSLPAPVAQDIAAFVRETKINGRVFLRISEQDLESMGVNKLWQSALLSSSRDLRQNVLKGRIWGTSGEDEQFPFSSELYNSSSSSIDVLATDDESTRGSRRRRNGRVRGMVETFERSGSFSSDGSFSEMGIDIGAANGFADEDAIVQSPVEMRSLNSSPVRRPLPEPPLHPSLRDFPSQIEEPEVEEPTMEELLAADDNSVTGARAWEEMDQKAGVTIRKLLTNGEDDEGINTIVEAKSGRSRGSNRSRDSRRIVTAVFAPKPTAEDVNKVLMVKEEELEAQLKSTRALLDEFKIRLEQVEKTVDEAQLELDQKEKENMELKERLKVSEQALVKAPSPANPIGKKKRPFDGLDPQSMTTLSQYVLLAGLGVCTVVLRVVLKKFVGRGLKN